MKNIDQLKAFIKNILSEQLFAVLATVNDTQPYTSIIAFAVTDDIKKLVFITPRATRKFEYIKKNNLVSLLVNNSSNKCIDISEASGITISGTAREADKIEYKALLNLFTSKHPQLRDFAESKDSAVVCVDINRFDVVERFQNVMVLEIKK